MSSERRIYGVEYKLVFTGYTGEYEVDKVKGPTDISADMKKVWAKIWETVGREVRDTNPDDWTLELSCQKCGEIIFVNDENQAEFACECTTDSPNKR
jgi:hypothetical protein